MASLLHIPKIAFTFTKSILGKMFVLSKLIFSKVQRKDVVNEVFVILFLYLTWVRVGNLGRKAHIKFCLTYQFVEQVFKYEGAINID